MKYVIDIDGTICTNTEGDYKAAQPLYDRIQYFNRLFDAGHTVIYFTARGMGRFNNDAARAHAEFFDLTAGQLQKWGVKFTQLIMGKPSGDLYIDDKAQHVEDFCATGATARNAESIL